MYIYIYIYIYVVIIVIAKFYLIIVQLRFSELKRGYTLIKSSKCV